MVVPPHTTPGPAGNPSGNHDYLFVVGFVCTFLLLITITYVSCRRKNSRSLPPPSTTASNNDIIRFTRGLDDHVIVTFPTFVYSETTTTPDHKIIEDENGSNCSICLEDYKPLDVVRLFPECSHVYHVSCIDTWLKTHPTCPMQWRTQEFFHRGAKHF
ncbi:putative transcription factor C2H2 family [Helianthus annuus]|nr:putative transcription factor C2H2 family [Helianthus annuus]